jgi:glycosyltransferase involved in cell wall biosynthesis
MILPELIADQPRLSFVRSMLTNTRINSTMVIFDLIPITHPEYVVESNGFVNYLTLLRCVDRVTCISRAIEQDVRDYLPMVRRRGPSPEIATHYLGGDFGSTKQSKPPVAKAAAPKARNKENIPLVLSVGTIEVRKNHRRIMHAMVKAQRMGYRFRGVFAGGSGWLVESFLNELKHFQSLGFQIELADSVSEEKLEQLYKSSAFTVYASMVEGFGLPIVESVVRGVPCIASNQGCMGEIVEQLGGCVSVDPYSVDSIASAIMSLLDDKARLEQLRSHASNATWQSWRDYAHEVYQFANEPKSKGIGNDALAAA